MNTQPCGLSRLVGLSNQEATCYLNSLLQMMYFTPEMRFGLFGTSIIDTDDHVELVLQLQWLFVQMQMLDVDFLSTVGTLTTTIPTIITWPYDNALTQ